MSENVKIWGLWVLVMVPITILAAWAVAHIIVGVFS